MAFNGAPHSHHRALAIMELSSASLAVSNLDTEHKSFVHDVAYDYYGNRMATCSADKHVRVFERLVLTADGERLSLDEIDDAEEEPRVDWVPTACFGDGEHKAPVIRCVCGVLILLAA